MATNNYKYFLYSAEQLKEKQEVLAKVGKLFTPGTVVVNGTRKNYTQLSDTPNLPRFIDTVIVAEGDITNITYTKTQVTKRRT